MMTKIAYMTIDDSPSSNFKNKVDFLLSKKIPTIFFCEGELIEERPEDVIYAIKKGFIIGNHSYNHPHFSEITKEEGFEEIEKTDKIIEEIYKKANVKRPFKLFRFPYGDKGGKNKEVYQDLLKKLEYKQYNWKGITYDWFKDKEKDLDCFWTYSAEEYRIKDLNKLYERMKALDSDSSEIILVHDHEDTVHLFKPIIEKLIERGITWQNY